MSLRWSSNGILIGVIGIILSACISSHRIPDTLPPTLNPTTQSESSPIPLDLYAIEQTQWDIYNSDPDHLWNRILRHFYSRTSPGGVEFGQDALDPLLWFDSTYLLEGDSYQRAVELLDEFLSTDGATLINDPLKHAMFQRDMWEVFDWLAVRDDHPDQREALRGRLARIIREVALTDEQIATLPDNYALAVNSGNFYTSYIWDNPQIGYLPSGLSDEDSQWIVLGRDGGPLAMIHIEQPPFYGRSVFLVLLHNPAGRVQGLAFAQQINDSSPPKTPDGLEVALVRKAFLINTEGEIVPSPLTESIQIRHFRARFALDFYQFSLRRELLFAVLAGGLRPIDRELMTFESHGDPFQLEPDFLHEAEIPEICKACHEAADAGVMGSRSILSVSRKRFPLGDGRLPSIIETTSDAETQAVIAWKMQQPSWLLLEALWGSAGH